MTWIALATRLHTHAVPFLSLFGVRVKVEAGRHVVLWRDAAGAVVGQAAASIAENVRAVPSLQRAVLERFDKGRADHELEAVKA